MYDHINTTNPSMITNIKLNSINFINNAKPTPTIVPIIVHMLGVLAWTPPELFLNILIVKVIIKASVATLNMIPNIKTNIIEILIQF